MRRVLVVDDEADVQALFQQRFRKELRSGQIEFHFAASAEDALKYLEHEGSSGVTLVLSDINMPGMSGLDLLKIAKEKFSHLKVILITAYDDDEKHRIARQYGSDDYLTKPVDFSLLKDRVFPPE